MTLLTLGNMTMEGDGITFQDIWSEWVANCARELDGPDGEVPTDDEIKAHLWRRFREIRLELLQESDYLYLSDCPSAPTQQMTDWRQALRDAPQSFQDVRDIVIADKPSG